MVKERAWGVFPVNTNEMPMSSGSVSGDMFSDTMICLGTRVLAILVPLTGLAPLNIISPAHPAIERLTSKHARLKINAIGFLIYFIPFNICDYVIYTIITVPMNTGKLVALSIIAYTNGLSSTTVFS